MRLAAFWECICSNRLSPYVKFLYGSNCFSFLCADDDDLAPDGALELVVPAIMKAHIMAGADALFVFCKTSRR